MSYKEKKLTCPYDKVHQIAPERMQRHLAKCQRQHANIKLQICKFNVTHHIHPEKLEAHYKICPDRRIVENNEIKKHAYESGAAGLDDRSGFRPAMRTDTSAAAAAAGGEDWEAEMAAYPVGGYNPTAAAMSKKVWRTPKVLTTKSERRQFRAEEADRWHAIDHGTLDKTDETETTAPPTEEPKKAPLRRPDSAMANQATLASSSNYSFKTPTPIYREPQGVSAPPPNVRSTGRGRGTSIKSGSTTGPASLCASGLGGRTPTVTTAGGAGSETGTFATSEFESLDDSIIIAGNLDGNMRMV